jgi:hypothetical protein
LPWGFAIPLRYPCHAFADLYHQRWIIEEAFKRLKLEAVSGLSQQALIIHVATKVLADNLTSLMCDAAAEQATLASRSRKCSRSYAASFMQRALPRMGAVHRRRVRGHRRSPIPITMLCANTQCYDPM